MVGSADDAAAFGLTEICLEIRVGDSGPFCALDKGEQHRLEIFSFATWRHGAVGGRFQRQLSPVDSLLVFCHVDTVALYALDEFLSLDFR